MVSFDGGSASKVDDVTALPSRHKMCGYVLLWQRYDNNKMVDMCYYGNVMTTRWRICVTMETLWQQQDGGCVTMATLWQQQDGGYVLLWKRYDNKMADMLLWQRYDNKMVAMRYYSTSSTVQS